MATAKEGVLDRIERYKADSKDRTHFDSGAWFSENFNRVNGRILGSRAEFNPLIPYAEQAAQLGCLELFKEIKIKNKPVSRVLESIAENDLKKPLWKRRVIDLGKVETHDVPTDSFADDDTIVWLAQGKELARDYGNFLRKSKVGIQEVGVCHTSSKGDDVAFGFWLNWLDWGLRSDFYCGYGDLGDGGGVVFGVSGKSAAGTSQKFTGQKVRISRPYTKLQAMKYIEILKGVKEGKFGTSKLEEVIEFFKKH